MRLIELDVNAFLDVLASDAPAPGGGSAAALTGACGAGLCAMTTSLTLGRKKYEPLWENALMRQAEAMRLKSAFAEAIDADTAAFDRVMAALRMPKDTEEQRAARRAAIETANKGAVQPPLTVLHLCREAVAVLEGLAGKVNPNCASDLGVAAAALEAAAKGAWLNVCINLGGAADADFAAAIRAEAKAVYDDVLPRAGAVFAAAERDCRNE